MGDRREKRAGRRGNCIVGGQEREEGGERKIKRMKRMRNLGKGLGGGSETLMQTRGIEGMSDNGEVESRVIEG